jgi:predicted phage tail protein
MKQEIQNIQGAGGGKGGKGRVAQEAANSLRSKQFATVIDVVSEGEIEGLVDGMRSIYLNDTPMQNADGSLNFKDVSYFASPGAPSMGVKFGTADGYFNSGGVRATTAVGVELKYGISTTRQSATRK